MRITVIDDDGYDDDDFCDGRIVDPVIEDIRRTAKSDADYVALVQAIENDFVGLDNLPPAVRQFRAIRHDLAVEDGLVLYGPRLVIPAAKRKEVLQRLHSSHQGITRTQQRARSAVFWHGITNDIRQMIEKCTPCQERLPSLGKETLLTDPLPTRPFEEVAADLFYLAGRHYLMYVD